MKRPVLNVLGLLLVTLVLLVALVPDWRSSLIGRVRGEPLQDGQPVSFWLGRLEKHGVEQRREAVSNLGHMLRDTQTSEAVAPEVVPALIAVVRRTDDDPDARTLAVAALRRSQTPPEELLDLYLEMLRDSSRTVRMECARALGDAGIKDEKVIAALAKRLAEEDFGVSNMAGQALVKLAPESIPALMEALGDSDLETRRSAAKALLKLGPRVLDLLKNAANDPDNPDRREIAKFVLERIQGRNQQPRQPPG